MTRALVLGQGGLTGLAWEVGVLAGWSAAGLAVQDADLVVGTSAGAVVGAHQLLGTGRGALTEHLVGVGRVGRLTARAAAGLARAQLARDRPAALRRLGAAGGGVPLGPTLAQGLAGAEWPEALAVAVVDAATGDGRILRRSDGLALHDAVAASCSIPGVYTPVDLAGVPHIDGGLRSPANVDAASGHDRVLVVSPMRGARERARRVGVQLRALPEGTRWLHVWPDAGTRRVLGIDVLDPRRARLAEAAGERHGQRTAAAALRVWGAG